MRRCVSRRGANGMLRCAATGFGPCSGSRTTISSGYIAHIKSNSDSRRSWDSVMNCVDASTWCCPLDARANFHHLHAANWKTGGSVISVRWSYESQNSHQEDFRWRLHPVRLNEYGSFALILVPSNFSRWSQFFFNEKASVAQHSDNNHDSLYIADFPSCQNIRANKLFCSPTFSFFLYKSFKIALNYGKAWWPLRRSRRNTRCRNVRFST